MEPEILLSYKWIDSRLFKFPIEYGMRPVMKFVWICSSFKWVIVPMVSGIDPLILFLYNLRDVKLVISPIDSGMLPESSFPYTDNSSKDESILISLGIFPFNPFSFKSNPTTLFEVSHRNPAHPHTSFSSFQPPRSVQLAPPVEKNIKRSWKSNPILVLSAEFRFRFVGFGPTRSAIVFIASILFAISSSSPFSKSNASSPNISLNSSTKRMNAIDVGGEVGTITGAGVIRTGDGVGRGDDVGRGDGVGRGNGVGRSVGMAVGLIDIDGETEERGVLSALDSTGARVSFTGILALRKAKTVTNAAITLKTKIKKRTCRHRRRLCCSRIRIGLGRGPSANMANSSKTSPSSLVFDSS
mmetsp:Transcript_30868/g.45691  ORF Transcript_30868/g.45691 Transcript_30868/m.45691 type:complete len:356 (-) Transcript_30868:385-1452(-)